MDVFTYPWLNDLSWFRFIKLVHALQNPRNKSLPKTSIYLKWKISYETHCWQKLMNTLVPTSAVGLKSGWWGSSQSLHKCHRICGQRCSSIMLITLNYCDVVISAIASRITAVSVVGSSVCSDADQRKHQSSASLAFLRGIHRSPVNSPHKGTVTENVSIWWRHHHISQSHVQHS